MKTARYGPVLLIGPRGEKFIVAPGCGMTDVNGLGAVDSDKLATVQFGSIVKIAGKEFTVLKATLPDLLVCLKRGAQIILPKDSAQIIMGCAIGPGTRVLEVGTGSGSLTLALAYYVGESGKVITYESNPKHAKGAWGNISASGMADRVEMRETDAATCNETDSYDAAVMDMPEPWQILEKVTVALKAGGYVCAYLPTMNQAETVIKAMRERGYAETHVQENLQRELVVGTGGTRPSFEMLGHTGYLCFGRKVRG